MPDFGMKIYYFQPLMYTNNVHLFTTIYVIVRSRQLEISACRLHHHFRKVMLMQICILVSISLLLEVVYFYGVPFFFALVRKR